MEYEVKFKLENKKEILDKLKRLNAQDLGKNKEIDIYLNLGEKVVRIRKIGKQGLITVKRIIRKKIRAKVRKETETRVENVDTLIEIFKGLGFSELKRKEKIRHTFRLDNILVLIDKLPFIGYFIELEGASEAVLKKASKKLDLDYNKASGVSYENIFFSYCIKNIKKFKGSRIKILPLFKNEREFLSQTFSTKIC
ncbi:MAG: class IV adenylate cyclase [Candidatus Omnitrophica bacterium]|nr:class IV adenylate cyclase [Candidatus Omnitrophota bacterium]